MKQLIFAFVLLVCGVARAQTVTTNIAYRVTIEVITDGVTNSVNTNFRYDYSTRKDALKVDGLAWAFASYRANGGTDTFGQWLKTDIGDRAKAYQDSKQAAENAVLLAKLQLLLLTNPDLLSQSDLNSLNTIAAKAP